MHGPRRSLPALLAVALLPASACITDALAPSPPARPIEELVDPDPDISARDLFYGVGGPELVPRTDVAYRLLERDESGFSSNFEIEDPSGRLLDAKIGDEARSEVAASRLLWAIGFHQPPVYYVREWRIADGPDAGAQPEARFRYENPAWKKHGEWSWRSNPFATTPELRGLIVMNILINNWDLKTSINRIYKLGSGDLRRVYVVKDIGASFGRTVRIFLGSTSDLAGFATQGFIRAVHGEEVEFDYEPVLLNWGVERGLHVDDVLWTCRRLARLRDAQWRDAFRAAGYSEAEGAAFIAKVQSKVSQGLALEASARS